MDLTRAALLAAADALEEPGPGQAALAWQRHPRALTPEQTAHARKMFADGDTVATIARVLGTSRPTIYRVLEQRAG